ncbi:uncharacterized protein PGRI_084380 [Penicillium griseofulvum]|uniref:Uncharacterized protein n=1 Tax=Penicillium patulum TaxID=5078 RepID=A0A135LT48_PENPA|nr:uncharacterized protein PGRI_084380 [Penicillium griseofulvum]KXG52154.1 hypothetical protein PGRI_084380 [Penicillium griseofulvum]
MADNRTLHLASMWLVEDQGITEFQSKLNKLHPGASIKVKYLRDKEILSVTGQFDGVFEGEIISLLARYIEEHRNDDLLEIPRVRQLSTSTNFDFTPLPGVGNDAQPDMETLVEDIMPTQTTSNGRLVKFWYPSLAEIGRISRDASPLLIRISQITETRIKVPGTRGLRISAQSEEKIREAVDTLDSVEECLDLIENPNRGLIILTPNQDTATFRIMTFSQISPTAVWRILIDRNVPFCLPKIMTLVVCEFDDLANEFRPLRRLRQPPQVALKKSSVARDWEGYRFPEIGPKSDPLLGKIDQHLAPKTETSNDKIDEHPYLSTGKAKAVNKWISRDIGKRPFADSHTEKPLEDENTSPKLAASMPPPESGVSTLQDQRSSGLFKPKPAGIKRRMVMLPDGTVVPPSEVQEEIPKDAPFAQNLFSRLSYRERVRDQQMAGSSISDHQEKGPVSIFRSATGSTTPGTASKELGTTPGVTGPAASAYFTSAQRPKAIATTRLPVLPAPPGVTLKQPEDTSDAADLTVPSTNQEEKLARTLRQPIRSSSPRVDNQPLGIPGEVDSNVNTKSQRRSVDSVMGEIKLMLETTKTTKEPGIEEASSKPKITDQKQPSNTSTRLGLGTEDTGSLGTLIDLDCEVKSINSGISLVAFDRLATVPSGVPEQSTDAEHDQFQHGEAPTFAETGYIFDMPNIDDTTLQPELTPIISPCPEPTHDPTILRVTGPTPVPIEAAQPMLATDAPWPGPGATDSYHGNDIPAGKQKHEQAPERRSKADEVAMEYLLQQIKDNPSPETISIEEIAIPLDATFGDPAPQSLSSGSRNRATHDIIQQRHQSGQKSEKVPFLHPDLIDISPEMLSPRLRSSSCDSLQQSDSKIEEQDAEPEVGEKLAVSEETQTREFHETMFHQRPPDKAFQWVDEATKAVKKAKVEVPTGNPSQRKEDTETNAEKKANVEALSSNLWQRRTGSKSTEDQPRKGTTLPTKAFVNPSREKKQIHDSTENLFHFLEPVLDSVRSFPGTLSLQIEFGLIFTPSLPASIKEREMSYREVHQLFFSKHDLTPPPISFFKRLTSSPADIDYLIDLEVHGSRLFDQKYSHRGVKYEFWCRAGPSRIIIISVNEHGHAMIRYPESSLGTVHLSFPSQVWDTAAKVQGFIEYITGADPDLEEAARTMAKSIRVEPNNQQLRILVRLPKDSKIRIDQAFMERWSRHPYRSAKSKDLFLQISETQELFGTTSILDPEIKVYQNAPLEKMVKDGKQWWQASIVSSRVDEIMKSNSFLEPGERNESWCATDLLGADVTNIIPSAENPELSTLGAKVGHSGIGAMFQLAKTVVQKIDAVGYWNRGPASIDKRTTTSNNHSHAGTGTLKDSYYLDKQVVPWDPPKDKKKW